MRLRLMLLRWLRLQWQRRRRLLPLGSPRPKDAHHHLLLRLPLPSLGFPPLALLRRLAPLPPLARRRSSSSSSSSSAAAAAAAAAAARRPSTGRLLLLLLLLLRAVLASVHADAWLAWVHFHRYCRAPRSPTTNATT